MATTSVSVPDDLLLKIDGIVEKFGFNTKEEFMQEAIKDKVLELQKKVFFEGTSKIAENLKRAGISEKDLVGDFEKKRH